MSLLDDLGEVIDDDFGKETKFYGVPLDDMSRKELYALVKFGIDRWALSFPGSVYGTAKPWKGLAKVKEAQRKVIVELQRLHEKGDL